MPEEHNPGGSLEVEILSEEGIWELHAGGRDSKPNEVESHPSGARVGGGRWWISAASAFSTLMLHGLLLGGIVMGTAGRPLAKREPQVEGISLSDSSLSAESAILIFINPNSITPPDWSPDELSFSSLTELPREVTDALLVSLASTLPPELGPSGDGTDEKSSTEEATGDGGAGRALLFGRYMGQIKARIERAWALPADPTAGFQCRVQIKQDRNGYVEEVTLQRCSDDLRMQLSLVEAIQKASPLSGPPDGSVFTSIVTMQFTADVGQAR